MQSLEPQILVDALAGTAEPLLIVSVDQPDWPVAFANAAFDVIGGADVEGKPFADVVESLGGRDLALEVSESVRARQETSFPVEAGSREYLLVLQPIGADPDSRPTCYVAYWRSATTSAGGQGADIHHALLKAKRRIRDLSRDDPVTGLLNARAFREVFEHDWAVAAREKTKLSLVSFRLDEFPAYVDVFGRHAADSCLRKVGHTIRRCLRRASDVVGRPDVAVFVALSHASEEANVSDFASRIAADVRELGLHHPRSTSSRFVTVTPDVAVADAAYESQSAAEFLDSLLARIAE
jgi:diguanylate cyclase (GGDEF)-like protein